MGEGSALKPASVPKCEVMNRGRLVGGEVHILVKGNKEREVQSGSEDKGMSSSTNIKI